MTVEGQKPANVCFLFRTRDGEETVVVDVATGVYSLQNEIRSGHQTVLTTQGEYRIVINGKTYVLPRNRK